MAFPFGFERRDIDDDSASGIGRFTQADGQDVARNSKILDGACQRKGVGGNDAYVAHYIDEAVLIKMLGVHRGGIDVGKHLELAGAAHIVAIAGGAVGDKPVRAFRSHLARLERFYHGVFGGHAADPLI